ncbi:MAG: FAD-dependent oxidoreductase [Actinopolymorphaceae bacterium]
MALEGPDDRSTRRSVGQRPPRLCDVPGEFDRAAPTYDRLVGANPGYHAHLGRSARRLGLPPGDGAGLRLLDLGCGTGASTAALVAVAPAAVIVAVDASAGMLEQARGKRWPSTVTFAQARVDELEDSGVCGPFDGVLAAYVVRNLPDPDAALRDIRALLRPGASLAVHEYSVADSMLRRAIWRAVSSAVIVPAGRLHSGDPTLYRYLRRSVLDFDGARAFSARLRRAGFTGVRVEPMSGWQRGIVHTFVGRRPGPRPGPGPVRPTGGARTAPRVGGGAWRPGRDRRARLLTSRPPSTSPAPARSGRAGERPDRPTAAVIGGGIAGVMAAVALAERGVRVTLVEREQQLGGRLSGWSTRLADGGTATMTRGFHAFFRQYYNLRALLRRVDPDLDEFVGLGDYPLLHADGRRESFARVPRTPPWSVVAYALTSPSFRTRDMPQVDARTALPLLDVSVPEVYERLDGTDAQTFLDRIRFPEAARALAFSVFSRSFFADPRDLSAAELATMFHLYFLGSSEGLLFDVPARPFPQAIWDPLAAYLLSLGADLRLGTRVRRLEGRPRGRGHVVHTEVEQGDARPVEVDAVVLAADVAGLRAVVGDSPGLGDPAWRTRIGALRTAPPFLVCRLWLDRPVAAGRPPFLGTAGFGALDNVSVLERYDDEAQDWARRTNGSVVELHAYALPGEVCSDDLRRDLLGQLQRVYPETTGAGVVDQRTELRADCPLFPPGGFAGRPTVTTPEPTVVLAGDLVRVDLPVALMERAATSGLLAANQLLAGWGLPGHAVWSVPDGGRWRMFRTLGRLAGPTRAPDASAHQPGNPPEDLRA